ncbi:helix-turn-helix domain-containing protein [Paraburkholderia sp. SARCC-3016]|uniref:GlxA family transcriptional regulator n=1 Tax=Paraburkholderia sp. SARCC-3016 TaxID=3058611 RepID=UPI0028067E32|nr:helix-turn-helix domain-containing protein [Paraburkholderia sp. SARCC-3016]MDQ7982038.1 helix-turn-helix domain-containing protein [Paraburkholderia sp. SARCC-3016]
MELNRTVPHALRQSISKLNVDRTTRIDIALFNGFALPGIAAIIEVFQKANALVSPRPIGRSRYDVSLWSAAGGRIASSSSVFVWTESVESYRDTNDVHMLFVAGGTGAQQACRDERLRDWLRRRHPSSEIVHSIQEGQQLLEAAGFTSRDQPLFDAAHEWRDVYPRRPFGEPPGAVDTALRIVKHDLGAELAQLVSESVVPDHKRPFASPITGRAVPQISEKIMESARWLEANVDQPISIDDAAQVAAMSERNFLRRFKSEMGITPSDYLLRARLNMSCRLLVESRLPVDKIARRCGIGSGGQLAKLFRKYLSTTPTDYRMGREASRTSS